MTLSKLLPRAVLASFVLLGTSQGPNDRSVLMGLPTSNIGGMWLVQGGDATNEDNDWAEDEDAKAPRERSADSDDEDSSSATSQRSRGLRGAAKKSKGKRPDMKELENVFSGIMQYINADGGNSLFMAVEDDKRLNELIDRMFVPRLQTTPKYTGALECLNESINRDILSGPQKGKRDSKALQQAYNYLRKPPSMLAVPVIFIELRAGADRKMWDKERQEEATRYEERGDPVPKRFLLTADELLALDAEEPRDRDEELTEDEINYRIIMINGWLKQQLRLRLYYRKRIGQLQGNPQDMLATFDAGPDNVTVAIEDIEGLSYNAELDPEPAIDESETEDSKKVAKETEL